MYYDYILQKPDSTEAELRAAGHIDALTYNRIVDYGALTEYQQRVIARVYKQLIAFETENADLIENYLKSYSIGSVSMSFGQTWNLKVINGIAIPSDIYSLLLSTGLCYPAI